jgi:nitrite reductase/ring-hydroxylating ferredoxin subunit
LQEANLLVPLNSMRAFEINGVEYCVAHLAEGWFALSDLCPHAGASLAHGWLNPRGEVTCPLHEKKFSLRTGRCISGEDFYRAKTFLVRAGEGGLWIEC